MKRPARLVEKIVGMKQTAPRVGLLLQDPENQFLRMDLLHEISFGMELLGLPESEIESRAKEALEIVGFGSLWPIADLVHPSELVRRPKTKGCNCFFHCFAA